MKLCLVSLLLIGCHNTPEARAVRMWERACLAPVDVAVHVIEGPINVGQGTTDSGLVVMGAAPGDARFVLVSRSAVRAAGGDMQTVIAHEIGHVLSGTRHHVAPPALMAAGAGGVVWGDVDDRSAAEVCPVVDPWGQAW